MSPGKIEKQDKERGRWEEGIGWVSKIRKVKQFYFLLFYRVLGKRPESTGHQWCVTDKVCVGRYALRGLYVLEYIKSVPKTLRSY